MWLDDAIEILSKTDEGKDFAVLRLVQSVTYTISYHLSIIFIFNAELRHTGPLGLVEFTDKQEFSKEFCTQIAADASVFESRDFKGLIFSIY